MPSRRLITVTRTIVILVAIKLNQLSASQQLSTSKSRDDAAMTAEVEVGKELSFSSDMNETVLERFAHLEGKWKPVEEENKSLCCG